MYDVAGRLVETVYGDEVNLETFLTEMELLAGYVPVEYSIEQIDWTKVVYPVATPVRVLNADLPRMKTEYSEDGRVQAEIDEKGNKTEYQYDALGRLKQVIYPDTTDNSIDDRSMVSYEYDKAGRRIREVDAKGNETEYKYDEAGRLIEVKDAEERVTKYEYDKVGRRTVVELPENQRSFTTYDEVGNIATYTDFNGEITYYQYDEQNRLELKDLEAG